MDTVWQWGLEVIAVMQHLRTPWLDTVMHAFTFLGEEEFYLLLLPLLLWSVDGRLGARVVVIFLLSMVLNGALKDAFMHPRPADLDPAVAIVASEGYGLPSGHAQSGAVVWGSVAVWARRGWLKAAAVALAALVGMSRVYLGVHFPTDVAAGWVIGAALLIVYSRVLPGISRIGRRLSPTLLVLVMTEAPAIVAVLHPNKDTAGAMGALAGVGLGLWVAVRTVGIGTEGPPARRILRFVVGAPLALVIYLGLKSVFPGEASTWYLACRFLRYWAVGLWMGLGAPWVFRWFRLAPHTARTPASPAQR